MKNEEQWLTDGICSVCRKRKYCTKNCKARIKAIEKSIKNEFSNIVIKRFFGG